MFLVLTPLLAVRPARAQDPFAEEADGSAAPPGVRGEAHQSLVRPKVDQPETPPPLGPVERLPPTAFPEWKTRGLFGGSLWLTFHGMPWPYYPKNGIGISGYAWIDPGYQQVDRTVGAPGNPTQEKRLFQQGRAALRLTPTFTRDDGFFIQGQVELIGNSDQTVVQPNVFDTDDLWVRTGKWRSWDIMVGRFEGFEVYHFGMGLDLNTLERQGARDNIRSPPDVHGFRFGFLRPTGLGNFAFHYYPSDSLRFEVVGQAGATATLNTYGARPAAVLDLGWLKYKLAGHYHEGKAVSNTSLEAFRSWGVTTALQFVFYPFLELGFNGDYGYYDHWSALSVTGGSMGDYDPSGSYTSYSGGGFANFRVIEDVLLGVGANYNRRTDATPGDPSLYTHTQAFVALQYLIAKALFVKVVGGYGRAYIESRDLVTETMPPWENSMVSVRVRFMYLF